MMDHLKLILFAQYFFRNCYIPLQAPDFHDITKYNTRISMEIAMVAVLLIHTSPSPSLPPIYKLKQYLHWNCNIENYRQCKKYIFYRKLSDLLLSVSVYRINAFVFDGLFVVFVVVDVVDCFILFFDILLLSAHSYQSKINFHLWVFFWPATVYRMRKVNKLENCSC